MKNNLFYFATSELSQDAFICWLLSYAQKDAENDKSLIECARDFLRQFIPDFPENEIPYVTRIQRQYKSIDILVTINDKYIIIIEDKTFTKEHDDQLSRYLHTVKNENPDKDIHGVFYKIGFQSDLSNVINNGYLSFRRKEILHTIEKYINNTSNRIIHDYYEYVNNFEKESLLFMKKKIADWDWIQINGFYDFLQNNIKTFNAFGMNCNYGYVSNRSGGFYGLWLYNGTYKKVNNSSYELYIQLEYVDNKLNICYKASLQNDGEIINKNVIDQLVWARKGNDWVNVAEKNNFIKPKRYGNGKTATLGIYDGNFDSYEDAIRSIENAIKDFQSIVNDLD